MMISYITGENSCAVVPRKENGLYLSRKRGFRKPGIGLSSVETVVRQYRGELTVNTGDGFFRVSVYMAAH